ncbi:MAG: class I SAM-dependent methyltransferase [Dehalococcoidia bacterium]
MTSDPYAPLAEVYDLEHDAFDDDLALYTALARRTRGTVLEIGCGTGRITGALARAGFPTIGVDPSPAMLAIARARADGLERVRYLEGDAVALPIDEPIGLAIFALDTFAHLINSETQLAALRSVRRLLPARGRLALDLSAPDPATWRREDNLLIHAWTRPLGNEQIHKLYARSVDELGQVQTLRLLYERWVDGQAPRRYGSELRLRYFFPSELSLLVQLGGFEPEGWYGDYDLSALDDESPRLILIARPARRRGGTR